MSDESHSLSKAETEKLLLQRQTNGRKRSFAATATRWAK